MNRDRVATFYFCRETDNVPVGKANTAMARSPANRVRIVSAVDADSFFIKRDPHYTDRIVGSRREQVEISAPLAVLKHLLVPTERRHLRDPPHFPFTNRRRVLGRTDRDWICRD